MQRLAMTSQQSAVVAQGSFSLAQLLFWTSGGPGLSGKPLQIAVSLAR
jgi:hypothetical protein